jgi:hypothetical protein
MENYGIYVALSIQQNGKYHWALYVPTDAQNGIHVHVTNTFNRVTRRWWSLEHGEIPKTILPTYFNPLVVALKVGECSHWRKYSAVQMVVKDERMMEKEKHGEEEFTCRVFILRILKTLHEKKVICCPDPKAVEREAFELAAEHLDPLRLGAPFAVLNSSYSC